MKRLITIAVATVAMTTSIFAVDLAPTHATAKQSNDLYEKALKKRSGWEQMQYKDMVYGGIKIFCNDTYSTYQNVTITAGKIVREGTLNESFDLSSVCYNLDKSAYYVSESFTRTETYRTASELLPFAIALYSNMYRSNPEYFEKIDGGLVLDFRKGEAGNKARNYFLETLPYFTSTNYIEEVLLQEPTQESMAALRVFKFMNQKIHKTTSAGYIKELKSYLNNLFIQAYANKQHILYVQTDDENLEHLFSYVARVIEQAEKNKSKNKGGK